MSPEVEQTTSVFIEVHEHRDGKLIEKLAVSSTTKDGNTLSAAIEAAAMAIANADRVLRGQPQETFLHPDRMTACEYAATVAVMQQHPLAADLRRR